MSFTSLRRYTLKIRFMPCCMPYLNANSLLWVVVIEYCIHTIFLYDGGRFCVYLSVARKF